MPKLYAWITDSDNGQPLPDGLTLSYKGSRDEMTRIGNEAVARLTLACLLVETLGKNLVFSQHPPVDPECAVTFESADGRR